MFAELAKALLATALFVVPGLVGRRVAVRSCDPLLDSLNRTLLGFGFSIAIVPTLSFFICLVTGARVSLVTLTIASALSSIAAWLLRVKDPWTTPDRSFILKLAIGVIAVALIYYVKYDTRFSASESCIYTATLIATGDEGPPVDLLRNNVEDARLGNPGVMSAFVVAYGPLGFRVLYGLCGCLLALGGFVLGYRIGGGKWWGLFGMVLLALNPYVASIPQLDENLITLALSMTLIPFLSLPSHGYAIAGALFGVVVLCRHAMLVSILALLIVAFKGQRYRGVCYFLSAFIAFTALENLHHILAFGSILRFETNPQYPPVEYEVAGIRFTWQGLMNWPFYDHLVRTPHNPFPMLVAWPLHIADHLGLILTALAIVGLFVSFRNPDGRFWLLWSLFVIAGVAVQEAWDHLNKMGVLAIVFQAVCAWIVAGAVFVRKHPKIGVPIIAGIVTSGVVFIPALRDWRVPADERYMQLPLSTKEIEAHVEEDAQKATSIGILPDLSRLDPFGPVFDFRKVRSAFVHTLTGNFGMRVPWGWFEEELFSFDETVTLRLDLGVDPIKGQFLSITSEEADIEVSQHPLLISGPVMSWAEMPYDVLIGRGDKISVIAVFMGRDDGAFSHDRRKLFSILSGTKLDDSAVIAQIHSEHPVIRVRVPAGSLSIAFEKNMRGASVYLFKVTVTTERLSVNGPIEPWHN